MTGALRVQSAGAGDAPLLHALILRAFAEYAGRLDPPAGANDETVLSIEHKLAEGGAFICRAGDVAHGCVFFARRADHLYVGRLSVPPEFRRRGIGDLLLQQTERHATHLDLPSVRLRVRLALGVLRAYYRKRGYAEIGLHSHAGYGAPTFVEMEKRL
jgi:GNAT superfamily N-acetyltransferase